MRTKKISNRRCKNVNKYINHIKSRKKYKNRRNTMRHTNKVKLIYHPQIRKPHSGGFEFFSIFNGINKAKTATTNAVGSSTASVMGAFDKAKTATTDAVGNIQENVSKGFLSSNSDINDVVQIQSNNKNNNLDAHVDPVIVNDVNKDKEETVYNEDEVNKLNQIPISNRLDNTRYNFDENGDILIKKSIKESTPEPSRFESFKKKITGELIDGATGYNLAFRSKANALKLNASNIVSTLNNLLKRTAFISDTPLLTTQTPKTKSGGSKKQKNKKFKCNNYKISSKRTISVIQK